MPRFAPARTRKNQVAARLLDQLSADAGSLVMRARALPLPPSGRAWVRVTETADADAWLIAWTPGSATGWHDHGGSRGMVRILAGMLDERYRTSGGAVRSRLSVSGETMIVPSDRAHDVANPGADIAVSLHVYAPRLVQMNFYPERIALAV
jgi:hypothetical protein